MSKETPNILSREFKANPFPFYARLRKEAPVYCTRLPDKRDAWLITRYDDVKQVLHDERFVKDPNRATGAKRTWMPGFLRALEQNMLDLDEPDHTRLRRLVNKAFTPRIIDQIRERVQSIATRLIDQVSLKNSTDLIQAYALPLPLTVIIELLGIPIEDREKFHRWSKAILPSLSKWSMLFAVPHLIFFMRYLKKLFPKKRANPEEDLISALVQAEESGDKLSKDELFAMVFLLIVAGHETTVNLIASGTLALLENPLQREKLSQNPTLIKPAIEELLRYTSPVETATERYTREDVHLHGKIIPKGALVLAVLASANRDDTYFENPDTLDITREKNPHLAFGHGIHFCLGAYLARMEGAIAIQTLFEKLPTLQLMGSVENLRWRETFVMRGLEKLPIQM